MDERVLGRASTSPLYHPWVINDATQDTKNTNELVTQFDQCSFETYFSIVFNLLQRVLSPVIAYCIVHLAQVKLDSKRKV